MTANHSTGCHLCSSSSVEYWDSLSAWICENCSGVYNENDVTNELAQLQYPTSLDSNEDSRGQEWTDQIAPKNKSEVNLISCLEKVEELANRLSLAQPIEVRAAEITTEAWKSNFMWGRTVSDTVAAAVYTASREAQQSVPPGVLAKLSGREKQKVKNTYKELKRTLGIETPPPTPEEYLHHITRELNLPDEIREDSITRLDAINETSGNPVGVAAAVVYETSSNTQEDITFRNVARVTELTKETIWRHKNKIEQ